MKSLFKIPIVTLLFFHSFGFSNETPLRKFTNTNGREIVARLLFFDGNRVTLQRENQKQFSFPINHFIQADRDYINEKITKTRKFRSNPLGLTLDYPNLWEVLNQQQMEDAEQNVIPPQWQNNKTAIQVLQIRSKELKETEKALFSILLGQVDDEFKGIDYIKAEERRWTKIGATFEISDEKVKIGNHEFFHFTAVIPERRGFQHTENYLAVIHRRNVIIQAAHRLNNNKNAVTSKLSVGQLHKIVESLKNNSPN